MDDVLDALDLESFGDMGLGNGFVFEAIRATTAGAGEMYMLTCVMLVVAGRL